jgi:hypothetical protein
LKYCSESLSEKEGLPHPSRKGTEHCLKITSDVIIKGQFLAACRTTVLVSGLKQLPSYLLEGKGKRSHVMLALQVYKDKRSHVMLALQAHMEKEVEIWSAVMQS